MSHPIATLSNDDLVHAVNRLSTIERGAVTDLIEALAEFDERRLYLAEGFSSLFTYCTGRLALSEHEAYHRIEAARAARRFPLVLERLRARAITLTAVGLLRPHLTEANHRAVLDEARGKSKRDVQELVARLAPRHDVAASIRKAPQRKPEGLLRPMNPVPHVTGAVAVESSLATRIQPCAWATTGAPSSAQAGAVRSAACRRRGNGICRRGGRGAQSGATLRSGRQRDRRQNCRFQRERVTGTAAARPQRRDCRCAPPPRPPKSTITAISSHKRLIPVVGMPLLSSQA